MNFSLGKDDEFEDEPEDELASSGMHVVVEDEEEDEEEAVVAEKVDDEVDVDAPVVEEEEEVVEPKDPDAAPDGLEELAELEKGLINEPLTFGGDDEE